MGTNMPCLMTINKNSASTIDLTTDGLGADGLSEFAFTSTTSKSVFFSSQPPFDVIDADLPAPLISIEDSSRDFINFSIGLINNIHKVIDSIAYTTVHIVPPIHVNNEDGLLRNAMTVNNVNIMSMIAADFNDLITCLEYDNAEPENVNSILIVNTTDIIVWDAAYDITDAFTQAIAMGSVERSLLFLPAMTAVNSQMEDIVNNNTVTNVVDNNIMCFGSGCNFLKD